MCVEGSIGCAVEYGGVVQTSPYTAYPLSNSMFESFFTRICSVFVHACKPHAHLQQEWESITSLQRERTIRPQ